MRLDVARQLLEHRRGGAAAAGAGGDDRHERAQPHGLQDLLRHPHLLRAVAAGLGGQRYADGVADPLLQQDAHCGGGGDDALGAHAGLGKSEVQGVAAARRQHRVDGDQVLHGADLGRDDDLVGAHPQLPRALGREDAGQHDRLVHDGAGILGRRRVRVLVHQAGQQLLVEAAPVDPNAHRLVASQRLLDDGGELDVALGLEADVAGVDAVLVERLGAGGVLGEQGVAVVVEVADQRHGHAHLRQSVADVRHGLGRLVAVHGNAHDLRAGAGQRRALAGCRVRVGRIRVGHRLHDDRRVAANGDATDLDGDGRPARGEGAGHGLTATRVVCRTLACPSRQLRIGASRPDRHCVAGGQAAAAGCGPGFAPILRSAWLPGIFAGFHAPAIKVFVLLVMPLGLAYLVWPVYAALEIREAMAAGDTAALNRKIDWPAFAPPSSRRSRPRPSLASPRSPTRPSHRCGSASRRPWRPAWPTPSSTAT